VRRMREALLSRPDVFAVAPTIRSPLAGCGDEGGKSAAVKAGLIQIEEAPSPEPHPTFYPVGCCYLCRRATFLELGGYDDLYAPFFWEDVDLGYRAWRRGLASWHLPAAVCHHEGSATIGQRPMAERLAAWHRGGALFHLRNLQDRRLRAASFGASMRCVSCSASLVFAAATAPKVLRTRVSSTPDRSRATIVLSKLGSAVWSAIAVTSARCERMPSSIAGA